MKKILIAVLAVTLLRQVNAAESTWLTDLPKAEAQAKSENKIILICELTVNCRILDLPKPSIVVVANRIEIENR